MPIPDAPMCVDEQWMAWTDAYLNQRDEVNVTGLGLAYMLRGDAGASNIDPYADGAHAGQRMGRDGAAPDDHRPGLGAPGGDPGRPGDGGPYVMWRDHPLVHVMVPVGENGVQLHRH